MNLTICLVLQTSILATGAHGYKEAYHHTTESGRPLVILVGADWCPGCRAMKESVMPQLAKSGALDKVEFAEVNTDREHELATRLMRGGSIPQLIMFRRTNKGWRRQQLTGAQSVSDTKTFLGRVQEQPATSASPQ